MRATPIPVSVTATVAAPREHGSMLHPLEGSSLSSPQDSRVRRATDCDSRDSRVASRWKRGAIFVFWGVVDGAGASTSGTSDTTGAGVKYLTILVDGHGDECVTAAEGPAGLGLSFLSWPSYASLWGVIGGGGARILYPYTVAGGAKTPRRSDYMA
jgi:hypothetical protein